MLDENGYPTDETLDEIVNWSGAEDVFSLMGYIKPLFDRYGRCEYDSDRKVWIVATEGWSSCESVIMALQQNYLFWSMCWLLSKAAIMNSQAVHYREKL